MPIGDIAGDPLFSIARWYVQFVRLVGRSRAKDDPMFLCRDRQRPYLYGSLRTDLKRKLSVRVQEERLKRYAPHGLRVLGYNLSKRANGEDLTVVHGGWRSRAHARYERFTHEQICSIPAGMLGLQSAFVPGTIREIHSERRARGASSLDVPVASGSSSDEAEEAEPVDRVREPPPGYRQEVRTAPSGRTYSLYFSPDGARCSSVPDAWRHYVRHGRAPGTSDYGSDSVLGLSPVGSLSSESRRIRRSSPSACASAAQSSSVPSDVTDLRDHVTYASRPSQRRPPATRRPVS